MGRRLPLTWRETSGGSGFIVFKRSQGVAAVAAAAAISLAAWAAPAHAEWKRAESPNFVVYYQGSESALRRYVRNLEVYDFVLRRRMGLPVGRPAARKLPIYLVSNGRGLAEISPGVGQAVAGVYFPRQEGIFATAIHDREQDYLLHEYFHHFSMQMDVVSNYPGWLIEGLAEYFMTAEIGEDTVVIGHVNENRASWIMGSSWIDLRDLLTKRPGELRDETDQATYYPIAWLLTHWFMSDETRRGQLLAYTQAVSRGEESVAAMETATGMSLADIRKVLRRYTRQRLVGAGVRGDLPNPEITVTTLPASADDLLLIGQRLKVGVAQNRREATAARVRRLAARHPNDPFAQLQLGHAELHFGDRAAGVAILTRLLETEPNNVEALQLLASHHIYMAGETPDDAPGHIGEARRLLAHAYQIDPGQYYTLQMLAETRVGFDGYPNENDLTTWDLAFRGAPQLPGIRLGYARALMLAGEHQEAALLLEPLANAPHGGQAARTAGVLLERARTGQPPLSDAEIRAAAEAEEAQPDQPPGEGEDGDEGEDDA